MSARRILNPSIVICIALGALLLIYFRPLALLSIARWETPAKSEFWIVRRPLADVPIEQTAGRNFTFYGYQFEVPWTDVKREANDKSAEIFYFSNNLVMVLDDPAQSVNFLKVLTSEGTKNEVALKRL